VHLGAIVDEAGSFDRVLFLGTQRRHPFSNEGAAYFRMLFIWRLRADPMILQPVRVRCPQEPLDHYG